MMGRRFAPGVILLASLASASAAPAANEALDLGGGVSLEVVPIKAGKFTMGSPDAEQGRRKDEKPHEVTIAEDFLFGRTPVTRGQFARFASAAGYRTEAEVGNSGGFGVVDGKLVQRKEFTWKKPGFEQTNDHPVVLVTLKDAQAFCRWMAKQTGRKVTLPTEAQWEYACRAGTASRFYSGERDDDARAIAWFDANSGGTTHAVGQKQANAWDIVDMSGNVWEWCSDAYGAYAGGEAVGDLDKVRNVLRGGSFLRPVGDVRSASRYRNTPGSRNADNGFRVVVSTQLLESPAAVVPPAAPVRPVEPTPAPSPTTVVPVIPVPEATHSPMAPSVRTYPPAPISRSSDTFAVGAFPFGFVCIIFVFVIGVLALIIYKVLSAIGKGSAGARPYARPPTVSQMAEDGFWVDNSAYRAGDVVTYTYDTDAGPATGQFTVQPGGLGVGQFIYTGARPMNVVLQALAAQHLASQMQRRHVTPPPLPVPQDVVEDQPRRGGVFRGFPSAY